MQRVDYLMNNKEIFEMITKYDLNIEDSIENLQNLYDIMFKLVYMIGVDNFFIMHHLNYSMKRIN